MLSIPYTSAIDLHIAVHWELWTPGQHYQRKKQKEVKYREVLTDEWVGEQVCPVQLSRNIGCNTKMVYKEESSVWWQFLDLSIPSSLAVSSTILKARQFSSFCSFLVDPFPRLEKFGNWDVESFSFHDVATQLLSWHIGFYKRFLHSVLLQTV